MNQSGKFQNNPSQGTMKKTNKTDSNFGGN